MKLNPETLTINDQEAAGRWLIVVALMMPKNVRRAAFSALQQIGEL